MYKNIADYGLIGDMHAAALVSSDGSIDYCSMPNLDSPTVFASLLDDEKGGFFRIQPQAEFSSRQSYIQDTNVLTCEFETSHAKATLVDFMPIATQPEDGHKAHVIHRCLKMESGQMDFTLELMVRPHYAATVPEIEQQEHIVEFSSEEQTFILVINAGKYHVRQAEQGCLEITFSLDKTQEAHFDFIYGQDIPGQEVRCSVDETCRFWREWVQGCASGACRYWTESNAMLNRSLLALKLLTFEPTGAIAAAATTSLPETVGGQRNWDYRFTWLRDASFTLKAMFAMGHVDEAQDFAQWLHNTYKRHGSENLQIMYSLNGESELTEKILDHLKGYKDSRPVRVGNGAFDQRQWDIYGEVMDTALRLSDYIGKIDESLWSFFHDVCELAAKNWHKPDDGIWEVRNGPFHFVYSKIMCWVALDRGIKIAKRYGFNAPLKEWEQTKQAIKQDVLDKGYDQERNTFVQRYGSKDLDASLLLAALMKFLPLDDTRIQGTVSACQQELMRNGFLLRYASHDGLEGEEGGFVLCNFWLIEILALSKKTQEARKILKQTLKAANHLGLFAEEYEFKNGELLGNFPQAFSHIGYINAMVAILNQEEQQQKKMPQESLIYIFKKLLKPRVYLNQRGAKTTSADHDIASQLKQTLNYLQGQYFDVHESRVDYQAMKGSVSFKHYCELADQLRYFDPYQLKTDEEKKAFWINIYNALIIHGVIYFDVKDSVKSIFNFFARIGYNIGGTFFNPNHIEHGILRKNRPHPFRKLRQFWFWDKRKTLSVSEFDPRIHFALVCASSSCPPIEFYEPDSINKQLDLAGRSFVNRRGLKVNKGEKNIYLSPIFEWYVHDFGLNQQEVITYAADFANDCDKEYITQHIQDITVEFLPYDWNLNRRLE